MCAVSGLLAIPRFKVPDGATDFNDLARTEGIDAVRNCVMAAAPVLSEVDVQADGPSPVRFESDHSPDIPARLFPGILGEFCMALAEELQVPFELPLCSALGTIAVAVQRKCRVQVKAGYDEPLNIFALCPLPPGERKSASVEACKKPLVEWQTDRSREMQDGIREAASERRTLEKAIDMKRGGIGKAKTAQQRKDLIQGIKAMEKELPDVPRAPRLLADDFTPEALALLMERHEQRIGLLEAEGGLFDTLAGRYSNGVPNLDAVLKSWSGETCQIDRRGAETIILNDPHLTQVISPQPHPSRKSSRRSLGSRGFAAGGLSGASCISCREAAWGLGPSIPPPCRSPSCENGSRRFKGSCRFPGREMRVEMRSHMMFPSPRRRLTCGGSSRRMWSPLSFLAGRWSI